jgi:hypothetical protein
MQHRFGGIRSRGFRSLRMRRAGRQVARSLGRLRFSWNVRCRRSDVIDAPAKNLNA